MYAEQKQKLAAKIESLVKHPEQANFGIVLGRCDLEIVISVAEEDKAVFTDAVLLGLKGEIAAMTGIFAPVVYLYGNEPDWLSCVVVPAGDRRLLLDRIDQLAEVAVLAKLKFNKVLELNQDVFSRALTEAHLSFRDDDESFFGEIIPWITGVVQAYADHHNYFLTIDWVKTEFKEIKNPVVVVATMVAMFLVQRGCEQAKNRPEAEQVIWQEIKKRMENLLIQ